MTSTLTEDDVRRREEESYFEGYSDGKDIGGYESLAQVVQALWPEPD